MKFFPRFFAASLIFLLVACSAPSPATPTPAPREATSTAVSTPTAIPSPTPNPLRTLVACLSDEPATLYLYGGSSRSEWDVLEALYDGPFDTRSYSVQPVILDKLPSLADGSAKLTAVDVTAGTPVVDVSGALVGLAKGVTVLASGCTSADCATAWDGASPLKMDQLSATFKIKTGIQWSDGSPLNADDSVFSYAIASDPATPSTKSVVDRTASYKAADAQTVVWTSVPGYVEERYNTYFFTPLPKHALQGKSAADLLKDPTATRAPLGWGPYILEEWVAGDHITFKKNLNYFRASEGLPKFDHLVYRFLGNPADSAKLAVTSGQCDIVDQNPGFQPELQSLINNQANGKLKLLTMQGPEWEHLDLAVRPAANDPGADPAKARPDLFGDARTRQALAQCIDRQGLDQTYFFGRSAVPAGTMPPSHPLYLKDLTPAAYDPVAAGKLLDAVGWKLPAAGKVRVAQGVKGVPDGTPFEASLSTTNAALRQQVGADIVKDLNACGLKASLQLLDPGALYAPGPQGPLFGRSFSLAEFYWEAGARPGCAVYTTSQIPSAQNHWIGTNVAGFSDPAYDTLCTAALWARPDQSDYGAKIQAAEKAFAEKLPAIPLFYQLHLAITRPDLCGLDLDPTARSLLWNLEAIDFGAGCKK